MFKNGFKLGFGSSLGMIAGLVLGSYVLKKFVKVQTSIEVEDTE